MHLKLRLIILNFLQFAIWGSWLISFGSYLGGTLNFTSLEIGSIFATSGIASLFMPSLMGALADRDIPAQILLGLCHFASAIFLLLASFQTTYAHLYLYIFLSLCFYMPTLSLSYSVSFNAMDKHGLDSIKEFPQIRMWGTIGFFITMIFVDIIGVTKNSGQLIVASILSIILGIYSFTLPPCDTNKEQSKKSIIQYFGFEAYLLLRKKEIAIFFLFCFSFGMMFQITNIFSSSYLTDFFGQQTIFHKTFSVQHTNILISLSRISEIFTILLIPLCMKKFGIKKILLISLLCWGLRFLFLGLGNPGDGFPFFILSMLIYGIAFNFSNIAGSLYIDKKAEPTLKASAQGLYVTIINGYGAIIGSYTAGYIVEIYGWPTSWFIFSAYTLLITILFLIFFKE